MSEPSPFHDEYDPVCVTCKTCDGTAKITIKHGSTCFAEVEARCHGMHRIMVASDMGELRSVVGEMFHAASHMPPHLPEFDIEGAIKVTGKVTKKMRPEFERWVSCGQMVAIGGEFGIVTMVDHGKHECQLSDRCPS